jgi:hypothetical protein
MAGNLPWYVFLIISLAAIVIPLVSKIIENRHQRRLKTLEVILNRKLDAYSEYVRLAAQFAYISGKDGVGYNEYLKADQVVRLIASEKVQEALDKVAISANRLRATGGTEHSSELSTNWHSAMGEVCKEMFRDIEKLRD